MTGTEPDKRESNDSARNQGLARSLFRVSLPRWRGGRYSLSKLFFNFYLLAMGSFVAIAFTADFVISTAQRGITDDYARRFMRGTITLIEDEIFRQPRRTWETKVKELDEKFSLPPRSRRTHEPGPRADTGPSAQAGCRRHRHRPRRRCDVPPASAPAARCWLSARWPPTVTRNSRTACHLTCVCAC
jgi:hypothetical protein